VGLARLAGTPGAAAGLTARLAPALLVVLLAAACASSGGGSTHAPAVRSEQARVARMVLADGDLAGYVVRATGSEVLQDQMPPPRAPRAALVRRLVRASWVASANSTLVARAGGGPPIFSDANLFAGVAAARRIFVLELAPVPGIVSRSLPLPPGAPAGAAFDSLRKGGRTEYELSWREGPVISLLIAQVRAGTVGPGADPRAIGATLVRASAAQSRRIADALGAALAV
jgi:hypothetical protein